MFHINYPIYNTKLPSTGKEVEFRPFLVGDERILFMAVESNDEEEIIRTTKQIVSSCLVSKDVDVETMTYMDIDFLFIAMRAKSVGEKVSVKCTCPSCHWQYSDQIDILNYSVKKNDEIKDMIELGGGLVAKMKLPTYTDLRKNIDLKGMEMVIYRIGVCMEYVANSDGEVQRPGLDFQIDEFINTLTKAQFSKLEEYVSNLPKISVNFNSKCERCGNEFMNYYEDFIDFFV